MINILAEIKEWVKEERKFALATVIKTWRSAPRMEGAVMAISSNQEILGSVSGGCVEGAVIKEAMEVIQTGVPKRLSFGVTNEDAWTVGLSCGGQIEVLVEPFEEEIEDRFNILGNKTIWEKLAESIEQNKGCVLVHQLGQSKKKHLLVYPDENFYGSVDKYSWITAALLAYKEHKNQIIQTNEDELFLSVFPAKDRLLIIGAAHISADLVDLAHQFNFETTVIDPRGIFTNKMHFTTPPDAIHEKWPAEVLPDFPLDADTYAVVLTHDPKIDDQALHILLRSEVSYIGALGSRKTHAKRKARLEEAGFTETEISRIHGPVGVSINARRPKEIALSILGELVMMKNRYL